jgi:hypothetical protein
MPALKFLPFFCCTSIFLQHFVLHCHHAKPKKANKKDTKNETHLLQFYPSKTEGLSAEGFNNKYTGFMIVI